MTEYQLYCFAQSGNAYRAALMLNLIGADWEPIWVDFFGKGEQRTQRVSHQCQRDGRGSGAGARRPRSSANPASSSPISPNVRASSDPASEDERLEALRWIIFDNQKVNGFLGPYRFLRTLARPAGRPGGARLSQRTHRQQHCDRRQAPLDQAVRAGRASDHRRLVAGRLPLLSGGPSSASTLPPSIRISRPGSTASRRFRAGSIPMISCRGIRGPATRYPVSLKCESRFDV